MKKFVVALCCVFALSLALVGCGGGGSTGANAKAAWVGTWDLFEMEDNGSVTSSDDIQMLRGMGLDVYLELNEDGTSALVLFGERMEGTWEAKSATAATMTMQNENVDMTIEGDSMKMSQQGSTLTFKKGEARTGSASAASASAASSDASASAASESAASSSASESAASSSASESAASDASASASSASSAS